MGVEIPKPKIGEACNGCGLCCRIQVCRNGAYLLKLVDELGDTVPGRCPALTYANHQYKCGLLLYPKKYIKSHHGPEKLREAFTTVIGAGTGCDYLGYDYSDEEADKLHEIIEKIKSDTVYRQRAQLALKILYNF